MNNKSDLQEEKKSTYITSLDELMPLIREQLSGGRLVRFSPKGKSMLPMLRENVDSVVLSPVPHKLKKYDLPLYQRDNGQYVLHRIVEINEAEDRFTCIGDNQFVMEKGLRREQIIAIVVCFERNGKVHKVTDLTYQMYCRFWHYSRRLRYFLKRFVRWIFRGCGRI